MKNYEYVTKKEFGPVKEELTDLIRMVQDEVRAYFTFRFDFIGSASRNMITREINGNIGYDFDVNIRVNDPNENYSAKELRNILKTGFDKHAKRFQYDNSQDKTRVFTIKVKDKKNSRILHSCDFAIVHDCDDGRQQYVRFDKQTGNCTWEFQPKDHYLLDEKIEYLKKHDLWQDVGDVYLFLKGQNNDPEKKSRSIFAETVKMVYNKKY